MNISAFAVRRPVLTIMAALIVILLGAISLSRLSIDLMPDISYPTLSVSTEYENASPEEVEELITRPIEEAMSAVPGVEEVTSLSAEGLSSVRVTFTWGTDLDAAANDIRDRLDQVIPRLPDDAERPRLRKFDLAAFPILILGVASDLDPVKVRRILDEDIKNRIERIAGVASMNIWGGLEREIHVNLNAAKLKALDLPIDDIIERIAEENVNLPAGTIEQGLLDVTIRTPGIYTHLDELRNTVVATRQGAAILLREIASVEDAWKRVTQIVHVNGRPGVRLSVNKQSGKNTVEVAAAVLAEIDRINQDFPQMQIVSIIDTSDYIRRSISNVGATILYGGVLAVAVLLFFLRHIPSTAVIATVIPISIVATFSLMYFGGFTLNLMTLGGLALGVGMLVDNAIVVLENIHRLREAGGKPVTAAVDGAGEVIAAVTTSTLTTLAVFLPLIFVRGMSGIMFKQLSYVVAFSLACSLVAALTLVPMLASRIHAPVSRNRIGERLFAWSEKGFARVEGGYVRLLNRCLHHRISILGITGMLLVGSLALIPLIGVELMPATDESEVRVNVEMAVGTRIEVVEDIFKRVEAVVYREVPEIRNTVTFIGASTWRGQGSHAGEMRIALVPVRERTRSSEEIAAALRAKLTDIPGATVRTRAGQGLFLLRMGTADADRVQVEVRGYDLQVADALARAATEKVSAVVGVTDVKISRDIGSPEQRIRIDRRKAADLNLSVSQIAETLQTVLTGTEASQYREAGEEYPILVKLAGAETLGLREVLDLPVTNALGEPVVLRNVVDTDAGLGPVLIERKDQQRVVYINANISGRDMGSILGDIRRELAAIAVPENFSIMIGGDYEEQQKAFNELRLGFILSLVLVYMVMASLYESLRDPLVVMTSVPLAVIGVMLMLFFTGTTFNVQSFIGCIMLGGIVVNNAILLVDHINLLRRNEAMTVYEAVQEAGRRRLRPIMMTAATTILAMTPLALGLGEGGETQAPMARALIGGLFSASMITLVVVPTVYTFFYHRRLPAAGTPASPISPTEEQGS
jgi:hydrophobic/amphiphilic exporter-1 (mainly G- bacteria), HAE1 family